MNVEALRDRTRTEHEATEARLPLLGDNLTRAEYIRALRALYPVVRGWELWAERHASAAWTPLLRDRKRSGLLESDLLHFGVENLPAPLFAPAFDLLLSVPGHGKDANFLGALYVIEGSTLGGQYIARHVEQVLGLAHGQGDAYFRGYGERTGPLWRELKAVLTNAPEAFLEDTVAAAKQMFGIFGEALAGLDKVP